MIWIYFLNIIKAEEKCPICEFIGIAKSENFAITGRFLKFTSLLYINYKLNYSFHIYHGYASKKVSKINLKKYEKQ